MVLYKFIKSFGYALAGVSYCIKTQRNMRIHLIAAAMVLAFSIYVRLPKQDFMLILFAIMWVIVAEMFNTSIEAMVDICAEKYHPLAKTAKDVAAGAVLLAALHAVIVGYFILLPYLRQLFF